eukprot:31556-Pelagococcus_subviridis.AAC.13
MMRYLAHDCYKGRMQRSTRRKYAARRCPSHAGPGTVRQGWSGLLTLARRRSGGARISWMNPAVDVGIDVDVHAGKRRLV